MRIVLAAGGVLALVPPAIAQGSDFALMRASTVRAPFVASCAVTRKGLVRDCDVPAKVLYKEQLAALRARPPKLTGVNSGRVLLSLRQEPFRLDVTPSLDSLEEVQAEAYPREVREAKLQGRVTARCSVLDNGALDACWTPERLDEAFGEATLRVMNRIRLTGPLPPDRQFSLELEWKPPPPAPYFMADCLITAQAVAIDCTGGDDPYYPEAGAAARAQLAARPLRLPGAPPGQRLAILVNRPELFRPKGAPGEAAAGAAMPELEFAERPSFEDFARFYPTPAMRQDVDGRVVLRCKVTPGGRLDACWVKDETPPEFGFGEAALTIAQRMRLVPPANAPAYDAQAFDRSFNFRIPR